MTSRLTIIFKKLKYLITGTVKHGYLLPQTSCIMYVDEYKQKEIRRNKLSLV